MKILVAGDAMIDRYWYGDITRISPEAPVPVFAVDRAEDRAGAAAYVAAGIRAMGIETAELFSESFNVDPVLKLRLVARGRQMARVDFDAAQKPIDADAAERAAEGCDIVVLSDYGKGALDNIAAIIWRCKRAGKAVFVDPKSRRFKQYAGCDMLKPNLDELRLLIGGWSCEEEMEHKVKTMQRVASIPAVLVTRGAAGMTLFNGAVRQVAGEAREVVDVCGAGDMAMAAFAAAAARGLACHEAAIAANKASGIAVGKFGAAVVTAAEVFG
jgi:rfaE bifunctional protein kinase chain/domain